MCSGGLSSAGWDPAQPDWGRYTVVSLEELGWVSYAGVAEPGQLKIHLFQTCSSWQVLGLDCTVIYNCIACSRLDPWQWFKTNTHENKAPPFLTAIIPYGSLPQGSFGYLHHCAKWRGVYHTPHTCSISLNMGLIVLVWKWLTCFLSSCLLNANMFT